MTGLAVVPALAVDARHGRQVSKSRNREAFTCLGLAAEYNLRRLSTYEQREQHADRIRIHSDESAILLRFEDVSYFNSVYTLDETFGDRLPEAEAFFTGSPFACTLVGPPVEEGGQLAEACRRRNWSQGARYAWMHGALRALQIPEVSSEFAIRPPARDEQELFLRCYLEIFGAAPERHAAAIRNMRHLFEWPDLHFLFAIQGGKPAGIAMLLQVGDAALYCAGAVMPDVQNQGCHAALLGARARLAQELGCREVFSWTYEGGQSEKNMQRAGLDTVGVTETWSFQS